MSQHCMLEGQLEVCIVSQQGGGAKYLCLPEQPQYSNYTAREASFTGPAQLSVACSMEKPWRAWYLFSREHDVIGKWRNFAEQAAFRVF